MFRSDKMNKFSFLQLLLQLLVSNLHQCDAIRLNPNGGYDIVIGIDENFLEPLSAQRFLEEIRVNYFKNWSDF